MVTRRQIKNEFFLSLLERLPEPQVGNVVIDVIVRVRLSEKYGHYLDVEKFDEISNNLVEEGYFRWNDNERLALTVAGLAYLERLR